MIKYRGTIKILKIRTPDKLAVNTINHPKILIRWLSQGVMGPKDADGMTNSVDTVCPGLPV